MKVKRSHVSVLAASCLLLASKLYEDEQCRDLSKFLIRQANLTFGKRDLHRMEMLLLSKFDWKIDDATAVDMLFGLFDLAAGPNKRETCYQLKNFIAHFLAAQLIDIELAHIPCLELALGTLQAFNYKSSFKVFSQLKMSKIPFDKKLVDEAVSFLRPRARKNRIPQSILNADEEDVLPLLSKVFATGCLVETPFGRKSIADVCAGPSTS